MSIRTIIEINHDHLHDLREKPEQFQKLLDLLSGADWRELERLSTTNRIPGIRFIGERHHSEKRTFTVE